MLGRVATFSEGAQPPSRRRSSILSQHSFRSSTDDLLRPLSNDVEKLTQTTDETSLWHNAPLLFAIAPAFAGLFFQNGSAVATDILLLGFGSLFLNWCVRMPWEWYHAAQQTQYVNNDEMAGDDMILEENDTNVELSNGEAEAVAPALAPADPASAINNPSAKMNNVTPADIQDGARQELKTNEILALLSCFLGPLIGAYLLHAIRSQLTRSAESLVSNYSLTIFVMGAELRPIHHVIKMRQAQLLHLQRVVRSDRSSEYPKADIQDISARLTELEARTSELPQNTDVETLKMRATVRQDMQPQLDALNRAVRRYEKRQAAQTMQIEARFHDLDNRLRDALALAAAAARTGQKPGIGSMFLTWVANMFAYGMQTGWAVAMYPYRTAATIANQAGRYVTGTDSQPQRKAKGQGSGNGSGNGYTASPRVQSRSGR